MAPNPVREAQAAKRSAAQADLDWPTVSKSKRHYHHHHRLHWKQANSGIASFGHDEELIQQQLLRSVSLALQAVGFTHVDNIALESFRAQVEEYMAHFLSIVRQSMLASRRIQPIPQDFQAGLASHQLSLRSLLNHLDPPVPPEKCQPSLDVEMTDNAQDDPKQLRLINIMLNGPSLKPRLGYVPRNLPALPSQHTYKAESVFNQREHDPKKVRELATEEGRLGEEALRRLVGMASSSQSATQSTQTSNQNSIMRTRAHSSEVWRETMEAMTMRQQQNLGSRAGSQGPEGGGLALRGTPFDLKHVGPPVNADRVYWRKNALPKSQGK